MKIDDINSLLGYDTAPQPTILKVDTVVSSRHDSSPRSYILMQYKFNPQSATTKIFSLLISYSGGTKLYM